MYRDAQVVVEIHVHRIRQVSPAVDWFDQNHLAGIAIDDVLGSGQPVMDLGTQGCGTLNRAGAALFVIADEPLIAAFF